MGRINNRNTGRAISPGHELAEYGFDRRRFLMRSGSTALTLAAGSAFAQDQRDDIRIDRWGNPITDRPGTITPGSGVDPNSALARVQAPSLKPTIGTPISGRWARLADMPFPVQEIYPTAWWTDKVAAARGSKASAIRRERFNIVANAGGIVGRESNGRLLLTDELTIYDPIGDSWFYGPRLPQARHHINLATENGYLFAIGGFTDSRYGDWQMRTEAWRLKSLDDRWERLTPLAIPQAEAVCIPLNGYIHIVGGRSPGGSRNDIWQDHTDTDLHWAYDIRANQWIERKPALTQRNSAAGATVGPILYVFGGRTVNGGNVSTTEAYDPLSDRWQTMRPMPRAQGGLAAASVGNTVFVMGGEHFDNGGGVYTSVWAYDASEDRWRSADPLPRPLHGLGAVTLNDAVYVMGGAQRAGATQTSEALLRYLVQVR